MSGEPSAQFTPPAPGAMFLPEDLPQDSWTPEPRPAPTPSQAASVITAHGIRNKVLLGVDESGQPLDFGTTTFAMFEAGMRDGCMGLACSSDGMAAIYTSHDESATDLTGASPQVEAIRRAFMESFDRIIPSLQPAQPHGWPMPRHGRLWLRRATSVVGISGTAENFDLRISPFSPPARAFEAMLAAADAVKKSAGATPHLAAIGHPSPQPAATPGGNSYGAVRRRNALAGADASGAPLALGAQLAAMVDLGVAAGSVSVAVFGDGTISLILLQNDQGIDLGLSASQPQLAQAAQALRWGVANLSPHLHWDRGTALPAPGEARFYRSTPDGLLGAAVPAAAVYDPQVGTAAAFTAALQLVAVHPSAAAAVAAAFPSPRA